MRLYSLKLLKKDFSFFALNFLSFYFHQDIKLTIAINNKAKKELIFKLYSIGINRTNKDNKKDEINKTLKYFFPDSISSLVIHFKKNPIGIANASIIIAIK